MYEIFEELMRKRGLTITKIAKATGISPSTITDWRAGRYVPKAEKRQKIAEYLGVSLTYLDTGKDAETIVLSNDDKDLLQLVHDDPKLHALLCIGHELTEDDFNAVKDMAERLRRTYKD